MATKDTLAVFITPQAVNEMWWLGLTQGILAIFFGITAVFWPGLTLVTLVYLFSAFILLWGMTEIIHGLLSIRRRSTWWLTLLFGLVGLGVGVYLIRHPDISFDTFIVVTGLTLIVRGLLDVLSVLLDRRTINNKILMAIIGIAAIAAGIILFLQPVAGGVAFVWILGLYALIFGLLIIVMSIEARNELLSDDSSRSSN
jgi:uncharacterized membrane protein HdeD (DUF308 family)